MRDQWSTRLGFLFAAIGAAVGLGNLWRFPFQAYKNGGGAFFLPYFVAILTCAVPLMIMEYAFGRRMRGGCTKAFKELGKKYEIIGWIQVMIPVIVMMFYCTIISISVVFMGLSIGHALGLVDFLGNPGPFMGMVVGNAESALDLGAGYSFFLFFSVIFVWAFNYFFVRKGISGGIEKICLVTTPLLLILMVIFMINALRLEGSVIGLNALFNPDFGKIMDPRIWVAAYGQVFFSTTLAVGVMIAYGSYLGEKQDIVNNSFITVFSNTSFDIIAGMTVFATLGYLVATAGVDFDSFGSGAGVAFIAFPIAISTMTESVVAQGLVGFTFFFCLFIAGITSSMSMIEAFNTAALDKFNVTREKLTRIVTIIGLGGSALFASYAGFNHILDIVDQYVANYVIVTIGLLEVIVISYVYGAEKLRVYANEHSDFKVGRWWNFLLKYFTPALLGITVVSNLVRGFMDYAGMSGVKVASHVIFGWGTVAAMLVAAFLFNRKEWTAESKEG